MAMFSAGGSRFDSERDISMTDFNDYYNKKKQKIILITTTKISNKYHHLYQLKFDNTRNETSIFKKSNCLNIT